MANDAARAADPPAGMPDRDMLGRLFAMLRNCTWIFENLDAVEAARSAFDYRNAA